MTLPSARLAAEYIADIVDRFLYHLDDYMAHSKNLPVRRIEAALQERNERALLAQIAALYHTL